MIAVAAIVCAVSVTPTYGQSFLNKISKGLDSVNKELDKLAGKGETTGKQPKAANRLPETINTGGTQAYHAVSVRSFSPQVDISLESCIREGRKVTITFYATNQGEDVVFDRLGISKNVINQTEETKIIGDNGESYEMKHYSVGSDNELSLRTTFTSGVRLKGILEIYGVPTQVKQLALVNIAGLMIVQSGQNNFIPLSFSFKNVPVYTMQQTLQMMNALPLLTIKEPWVEKAPEKNYTVESVEFTDKYTKVDLLYKNTKYNPEAHLTIHTQPEICILANGQTYPLIGYSGITARNGDVAIKYNSTGRYSYIFEPVPTNIASFDILGEEIRGITIKSSIDIPKTKGVFQSLDTAYDAYDKRPRMTAADRAKYKIDQIKDVDLQKQPNNQLSKGKLIYKCNKGTLETFLLIVIDQITNEYLASYDQQGNLIDCIRIGVVSAYGGDRGYADISGDKITAYSWYPTEDENESGDSKIEYRVGENLKFIKQDTP